MKKTIKVILVLLLFLAILTCKVYAEDEDVCKLSISADKTKLSAGDTVTLTIKLSDIDESTDGIINLVGEFEFDQDVFEIVYIEDNSIEEEIDLDTIREETEIDNLKIAYYDDEKWNILLRRSR